MSEPRRVNVMLEVGNMTCECGGSSWTPCDARGVPCDPKPGYGNLNLCDHCGLIAHWPDGLVLRPPTAELNALDAE